MPIVSMAIFKAASLVNKPSRMKTDPKNWMMITINPMSQGKPAVSVKNCIVFENPYPPNKPSNACAPCGHITTQIVIRIIN